MTSKAIRRLWQNSNYLWGCFINHEIVPLTSEPSLITKLHVPTQPKFAKSVVKILVAHSLILGCRFGLLLKPKPRLSSLRFRFQHKCFAQLCLKYTPKIDFLVICEEDQIRGWARIDLNLRKCVWFRWGCRSLHAEPNLFNLEMTLEIS